ncbi:MAG: substrate-binding domain-containing protein [Bacilli bacterium]
MKNFIKVVAFTFLVFILNACSSNSNSKTIGFVANNMNDTQITYVVDAAKKIAKDNDITLKVVDSQEDVIKQQDHVSTLISQGVDGLIVIPVDTSAMKPITELATKDKIPLVYVNRNPFGDDKTLPEGVYYVGSKEEDAGIFAMEFVGEKLGGNGSIAILQGLLTNEGAIKRTEGVNSVVASTYPNIKVVAQESAQWQRDKAVTLVENWISVYGKDLKAIVSNNDEMALGALVALESAGRSDVIVTGVDAIPDALKSVKDGKMAATVLQDSAGQGEGAIKTLKDLFDGKKVENQIIWLDFVLVTPDNVDEFIK